MTFLEEETIPVTLMPRDLKNTELIYESLIYSHAFRAGSVFASTAKHCLTFLVPAPMRTSLSRDSLALDITHIYAIVFCLPSQMLTSLMADTTPNISRLQISHKTCHTEKAEVKKITQRTTD